MVFIPPAFAGGNQSGRCALYPFIMEASAGSRAWRADKPRQ
jgi:hypothetical protein